MKIGYTYTQHRNLERYQQVDIDLLRMMIDGFHHLFALFYVQILCKKNDFLSQSKQKFYLECH